MGEALERVMVKHLSLEEFPYTTSILAVFPDADVVNFGTDNGDSTAVARAITEDIAGLPLDIADQFVNITSRDTLEDLTGQAAKITGAFGKVVLKLKDDGAKVVIKAEMSNLGNADAVVPFKVAVYQL